MAQIVGLFLLKLVTLAGSTATTFWLVSFIAFTETLGPYRWHLLLGGLALVAVGEFGSYLLGRHMAQSRDA